MSFTAAIVGRPNVGKSSLFNRLVGRRYALVDDTPGVTRDRREGEASLGPLRFTVIDTAGLAEAPPASLEGRMQAQTERAVAAADVVLLVVDGRAGITPDDRHFARALRRTQRPVLVVVNKCEGSGGDAGYFDAFGLGLGEPVAVSAEHGEGMGGLYVSLLPFAPPEAVAADAGETEARKPLRLAIVGRPNVGKSTLLNRLVGEERAITGAEPGITRDSIAVEWLHDGRPVQLVDTAGLRRRARIIEKLEKLSSADSLRVIRQAEVVVLILDSEAALERQDLSIASVVIEEGRALVIAINKWDLIEDRAATLRRINERLADVLPQAKGVPVVPLSALTGRGVAKLMPAVFNAFDHWETRLPTAALNRWLEGVAAAHPPPVAAGRRIKLRYITQVKARPPTFAIFVSKPTELPAAYQRYLTNQLRAAFGFAGVPIRLHLRAGKNPYAGRKKQRSFRR
jgi:GTP-binding protein